MWSAQRYRSLLMFASLPFVLGQPQEMLRLANSTSSFEGRLEIFYNGSWGTVCDHGFSDSDASVACRSLGLGSSGVSLGNRFGPGNGRVWLDDVTCYGNEATLSGCRHDDWGKTHCSHAEDVSVACYAEGAIRLVGGEREGRLEIFHDGEWGTVCSHGFSSYAVQVACRSLGFGNVGRVVYNQYNTATGRIWLHYVQCVGNEQSLFNCSLSPDWGSNDCSHTEDVFISCNLPARLVGSNRQQGRLEIYHNGEWGTVCDSVFDDITASVACYSMGFGYVGRVLDANSYGPGVGRIWLDDVVCIGNELLVDNCRHSSWGSASCNHTSDVSISCINDTSSAAPNVTLRLSGGDLAHEGRLEVYRIGSWGTICDDYFTSVDAAIACRTLGYSHGGEFISNYYGPATRGRIWLVRCLGTESSFGDCPFYASGMSACGHSEDVSVSCLTSNATFYGNTTRLVGSRDPREGRLEIYHNRQWGTVCDDSFDDTDARVACFSLGFGYIGRTLGNQFGPNTAIRIWIDDVACVGYETFVGNCRHNGWGSHNCGHSEDVSISCVEYDNVFNGSQVRLVGSSDAREGRLEVFHDGVWGTVCDDGFDDVDARVACYSLGFGSIGSSLANRFGSGSGRIWLSYVACSGYETFIGDCRHNGWGRHGCSHNEDVSISCVNVSEGAVRLVAGSFAEGRLEIFHSGQWGTVCNDAFNDIDAKVACRSLGFGFVGRSLHRRYGSSSSYYGGRVWLDGVQCLGSELSLADCPHNDWGAHDCYSNDDVSISCRDNSTNSTTVAPPPPMTTGGSYYPWTSRRLVSTRRYSTSAGVRTRSTTTAAAAATVTTRASIAVSTYTTAAGATHDYGSHETVTLSTVSSANTTGLHTMKGSHSSMSIAIGLVCAVGGILIIVIGVIIYRRRKVAVMQSQMLLFQSATQPDEPDVQLLVA